MSVQNCIVALPQGDIGVYKDYDLTIYANAAGAGSTYYARATPCQVRQQVPHRPVVGTVDFGGSITGDLTDSGRFQSFIRATLHELNHVLAFSPGLYNYFNPSAVIVTRGTVQFM